MQKFTFLIGISGAGKSTYTKNNMTNNTVLLSSDDIRIELYGTLTEGNKHNVEVFDHMNKQAMAALEDHDTRVIYDATNLSRKKRKHIYDTLKRKAPNVEVESVIIFMNPETAKYQNNQRTGDANVPENVIERQFMSLQIPRIGVDTDSIISKGESWFNINAQQKETLYQTNDIIKSLITYSSQEMKDMLELNYQPHETPYHLESIDEHINMVFKNARETNIELIDTAIFHDIGKGYVKNKGRNNTGQYMNHDVVSAQIMLNYLLFNEYNGCMKEPNDDVELVHQHMVGHSIDNININKYQKKNGLNDEFITKLNTFCQIEYILSN